MGNNVVYVDFINKMKINPLSENAEQSYQDADVDLEQNVIIHEFINDLSHSLTKHELLISQEIVDNYIEPMIHKLIEFNFKKN